MLEHFRKSRVERLPMLNIYSSMYHQEITPQAIQDPFLNEDVALEYASWWLVDNPRDHVMLTWVRIEICKHCKMLIREKPGWVVHRWVHITTTAHICLLPGLPQAEPLE